MKIVAWVAAFVAVGWTSSLLLDDGSMDLALVRAVADESPWFRDWRPWPASEVANHVYGAESSIIMDFEVSSRTGDLYALAMPEGRIGRIGAGGTVGAETVPARDYGFPIDLEVDSEDRLLVLIAREDRVVRLASDLTEIDSLDLAEPATRVSSLGKGFVTLSRSSGSHLFCRYDEAGRLAGRFGAVLEGGRQPSNVVQGWLFGGGSGGVSYAALYLGVVATYDESAEPRFMTVAVGPRHVPRAVPGEGGVLQVEPGSPFRALDLTATEKRVIVLSESSSRREGRFLDVYRLADGGYLFSYRLPTRPKGVAVAGHRLFTAEGNRITEWSMPADVDEL